jgi:hypothetical protein
MHNQNIGGAPSRVTALSEDARTEIAVLRELIDIEHPITLEELIRHFGAFDEGSEVTPSHRDSIERGVRDLIGGGLLNRTTDNYLVPTRAAYRFAELAELP